ncbi:Putative glycosyltransferase [hydrothermal vent metagenome]|uniref:Glycosyltransferase n=1 Tax=hydrothermal vent metagenome TaxID=652676 RepID=A0A3B0VPZ4_9ZZZZ
MRILVISQYFWPENFRINDLCSELVLRGHEVTVLTGKPNYPEGKTFKEYLDDPKKFDFFKGCNVVRVPMLARGKRGGELILNYITFALSAMFIGAWKLKKKQFDVIFVFEPSPITIGLPAVFLKKIKKVPVIFWVLDLWPETLEAVGVVKSPGILGLVGRLVAFIYNHCDLVLGQSKAFYSGISRYCKDEAKIKYFPSWSESVFLDSQVKPVFDMAKHENCFKVLFAGNIGDAQDFPALVKAVEILKNKQARVKVFIVGDGRAMSWLESAILKYDLVDYIYLLGRHPLESMPSFYASADALFVSLKESSVFSMTIPGKLQSYMMAGKPILTMLSGEGSRVIDEANCGLTARSGDAETLAENMLKMSLLNKDEREILGDNARLYSEQFFNRDKLISQLEGWFVDVVDNDKEKNR